MATGNDKVTILQGIDVASDDVGLVLTKALTGITITLDVVIHNAGSFAGGDVASRSYQC